MKGFKIPLNSDGCGVTKDCQTYCKALPIEDSYNCLDKFGFTRTADYCLKMESFTSPKYRYQLKNKYTCLTNPDSLFKTVAVAEEVYKCLNLYNDFMVETCLQEYEGQYGTSNMGFIGGSFANYANLTNTLDALASANNAGGNSANNGGPNSGSAG